MNASHREQHRKLFSSLKQPPHRIIANDDLRETVRTAVFGLLGFGLMFAAAQLLLTLAQHAAK